MTRINKRVSVFGSYGTRALLLASGLIAAGIATMILFAPNAFYGSYGIDIGADINLANELKAPAGPLLLAGLLMMAGVFRSEFTTPSLATAAAVYLSYGLSRILSMAMDGVPHSGLVSAASIEVAIGAICFVDLLRHRKTTVARRRAAGDTWYATTREDAT
ncbi:MAG: DUF4345 domain-containing protein [Gammaproteobacteria bacterium]|nr:DUF4345 domain-containing protein [Gammaproteobacteria bacterium]